MKNNLIYCRLVLALLLLTGLKAKGQSAADKEYLMAEFGNINNAFHNLKYTAYNIHIRLDTDTANGVSIHEEQEASYVVSGTNYYYKMGENEYLQNESVLLTISHESKFIALEKATDKAASDLFPSGEQMSQLLASPAFDYSLTQQNETGKRTLLLSTTNTSLPYRKMRFSYDPATYELLEFGYEYYEPIQANDEGPDATAGTTFDETPRRHVISFKIEKTGFDITKAGELFSESRFVWFDGKKFLPAAPYKAYEFYDRITGETAQDE